MRCRPSFTGVVVLFVGLLASAASAQLRVMNYNVAQLQGDFSDIQEVFEAAHDDDTVGFTVPVGVFIFQEVQNEDVAVLESMLQASAPPGVSYLQATYTNFSKDGFAGAQAMFYWAQMLDEIESEHVDFFTGGGRFTDRWTLKLKNYDNDDAKFYVYSSHLKASSGGDNEQERLDGVISIRINADALGPDQHIIYAGDFNFHHSGESGYLQIQTGGNGQAIDPMGTGSWSGAAGAMKHTQSPRTSGAGGLIGGGMDDRFDFQFSTNAFHDADGLALIPGTYRAFGNDGQHYNESINDGNNFYFTGEVSRSNNLADALHDASDHIPVVADYQIPATMFAVTSPTGFGRVIVGESVDIQTFIINQAVVDDPIGADELDYTLVGSDGIVGAAFGSVAATGVPTVEMLSVDTSSPGLIEGMVTLQSDSEGVDEPQRDWMVTGTVLDTSNPSFAPDSDENEKVQLEAFDADTGVQMIAVDVYNYGFDSTQALMDVDDISELAAPYSLNGPLPTGIEGEAATVMIAFDTTGLASGEYETSATISTSDEDVPGETTDAIDLTIIVTVNGGAKCPADLSGDGVVDVVDLLELLGDWGGSEFDLSGDGVVDSVDLLSLLGAWGKCG